MYVVFVRVVLPAKVATVSVRRRLENGGKTMRQVLGVPSIYSSPRTHIIAAYHLLTSTTNNTLNNITQARLTGVMHVWCSQDTIYVNASTGKKIETYSIFDLEGSSPNEKPASVRLPGTGEAEGAASEEKTAVAAPSGGAASGKKDFSGVWTRERTHNVDSYVGKCSNYNVSS
jgi:hypothetical protein